MLLLAVVYYMYSFSIKEYGDAAVNSRFMPQILGIVLLLLSIAQIVSVIVNKKALESVSTGTGSKINAKVIQTLILIAVYATIMIPVGFLLSTMAYIFLQTMILTPKEKQRYLKTAIISVGFSIVVYMVFVKGFELTLPSGILG